MTSLLLHAFAAGKSTIHTIGNTYDRIGFYAMRALIDDQFLNIDPEKIQLPPIKKAAEIFNDAHNFAQRKILKDWTDTCAAGTAGTKPDIKKPLFKVGELLAGNLGRIGVSQMAVMTLGAGIAIAAAMISSHYNAGSSFFSDTLSTYLSAKPNSNPELSLRK